MFYSVFLGAFSEEKCKVFYSVFLGGSVKIISRVKRSFGVILAIFGESCKTEKAYICAISWADIVSESWASNHLKNENHVNDKRIEIMEFLIKKRFWIRLLKRSLNLRNRF